MNPTMECPNSLCKEIAFRHINTETDSSVGTYDEYRCDECGHQQSFNVPLIDRTKRQA